MFKTGKAFCFGLCVALSVPHTMINAVASVGNKKHKSWFSRLTDSIQQGANTVWPDIDINVRVEKDSLGDISHNAHDILNELRNIIQELGQALDNKTHSTKSECSNLLQELDILLHSNTDNINERLTSLLEHVDDLLTRHVENCNYQIHAIMQRFDRLIAHHVQHRAENTEHAVRAIAYAGSGAACMILGTYLWTHVLTRPTYELEQTQLSTPLRQHGTCATLFGLGALMIYNNSVLSGSYPSHTTYQEYTSG